MDDNKQKYSQLFFYLISSFEMSALVQMGKIKNPATDKLEKDLMQAQLSIDIIDMMKEKTKGNLNEDEKKFLDNMISQIKLNYVDEVEKDKKEKQKEEKDKEEKSSAVKAEAKQEDKKEEKSEN
jgi:PIN domain nuclease of toxin-antitoxin system